MRRSLRTIFPFLLLLILFGGCSKARWFAKIYLVKAENAYAKAYGLRVKKVPYQERLRAYQKACDFFTKAYREDSGIFTLNRIDSAIEACTRVKNQSAEEEFRKFAEDYIRKHPAEAEYGDAFPSLEME